MRAMPLLGRLLLALLFIASGLNKFADWSGTVGMMRMEGLAFAPVLLAVAALIEVVGGAMLVLGWGTRYAAALLFLYLIPTTLIFHDFWLFTGAERQLQMVQFLKNVAIMGGLLELAAFGAGSFSVDARGPLTGRRHPRTGWGAAQSPA